MELGYKTKISRCHRHTGFLSGPLLFFQYLVPQKSFAILVIWAVALTWMTPKSLPSIPTSPLAGQLHLDVCSFVPQPWT